MTTSFDAPLFVFEMANNHMGSLEHGLRILREFHQVSREFPFRFAFKFQYRDLDTLIHPDYRARMDLKYIKRFSETCLPEAHLQELKEAAASLGFFTMCTPFDEASVDRIERHGFDLVKIASCSFTDWPLLERIARTEKPIIASTAGVSLEDMDKVVSFFEHRRKDLTLMHCVAEYSTADARLELNQIDLLRQRYPQVRVGYSTHEAPDRTEPIAMAIAKGAAVFEKHVGVPTEEFSLNGYSADPEQARRWLSAAVRAFAMAGVRGARSAFSAGELASLQSLARGVFARRPFTAGERVLPDDVFLAIPTVENQLLAWCLSKYLEITAVEPVAANAPLLSGSVTIVNVREKLWAIVQQVKDLLKTSGVVIPVKADLEVSHHYGIDRFNEFGLTMLTVVNRGYCKKVLALLPGQTNPEHCHQVKEETFHVLHGDVWVELDGQVNHYAKGDVILVERGIRHRFGSRDGAVLEEVSLTHQAQDSFYSDPAIHNNPNRKSYVTHWFD